MYSKIIKFAIIVLSTVSMISCGGKVIFQESKVVSDPWSVKDSITFTYEILDTLVSYDLALEIEHAPNYGYENLYVMVNTKFPDGDIKRGPLSLQLANSNGTWIGSCNDEKCNTKLFLSSNAYYRSPGKYELSFGQFSREEMLAGIKSLTLSVQKSKR